MNPKVSGKYFKVSGQYFKAVVQVFLLFGADTWVLIPRMEQALIRFQHRFVRRITGRQPRRRGGWELGLSPAGSGNYGSRFWGDGGIRHKEAEYGRVIYCDTTDSGPL